MIGRSALSALGVSVLAASSVSPARDLVMSATQFRRPKNYGPRIGRMKPWDLERRAMWQRADAKRAAGLTS